MKKIALILSISSMILMSLTGCGDKNSSNYDYDYDYDDYDDDYYLGDDYGGYSKNYWDTARDIWDAYD